MALTISTQNTVADSVPRWRQTPPPARSRTRLAWCAGGAVLGGILIVIGSILPWLSIFAGLIAYRGIDATNGRVLATLGALLVLVGVAHLLRPTLSTRLAVGSLGFLALGFGGYLLLQLRGQASSTTNDPMVLLQPGPGLYVAATGAGLAFLTLFLPTPKPGSNGLPLELSTCAADAHTRRRTSRGPRLLRLAAIAALTVTAIVHIPVAVQHLNDLPYLGWLFVAFIITDTAGIAFLTITDHRLVWLGLGVLNLTAIIAYLTSRTTGLPLASDDRGQWANTTGWTALIAETLLVALATTALLRARHFDEPDRTVTR